MFKCSAKVRDKNAELVRRPLAQGRQPPALGEALAVEDAQDDVRVADVYR